jgi:hypothetical protein
VSGFSDAHGASPLKQRGFTAALKAHRALLHYRGVGADGAQAKHRRKRQGADQEPAAAALPRSDRPHIRPGYGARSQHLVGGALAVVVTLIGWLVTMRGAVLLVLSEDVKLKLFEALRYEERFFVYMGVTLILGIYLTFAAFSA